MANAYYGKKIIGELSDAQTLPDSTTVDSTNMVYVGGNLGGNLWIDVYANTAISIATGQAFNIELEAYSSDTAASATPPFSTANNGGLVNTDNGASAETDAHYYLLHKTSDDDKLDFSQYSLITQCAIPVDLLRILKFDYVQLKYTTDANESSEKVDAFVYAKI